MIHESALSADEALLWLRGAWNRSRGMSADVRKKLMSICLAHCVRGMTREQGHAVIDALLMKLTGRRLLNPPVPEPVTELELYATPASAAVSMGAAVTGARNTHVDSQMLDRIRAVITLLGGHNLGGEDLETTVQELERTTSNLVDHVYALADKKRFMNTPVEHVLSVIDVRLRQGDEAGKHAAQEAFDRLLKSLDPAALKDSFEGKGLRFGPFHKAALYDAVCEKYAQMNEYHEKGRLIRDFRAMYKSRLAELAKSEGAVE